MFPSFNISVASFALSGLFSILIAWQAFRVWKLQRNRLAGIFFKSIVFFSLYFWVRALASFLFSHSPCVLTGAYILSHVFLGIGVAYTAKFGFTSLNNSRANSIFLVFLILYASDVILNIFLPNHPRFNQELNIIEWGTNKYVGIYHTLLNWSGFLFVCLIFFYQAIKNWDNKLVRTKSLLIAGGLLSSIFLSIPRNIFRTPTFQLIADLGLVLSLGIILLGTTVDQKEK